MPRRPHAPNRCPTSMAFAAGPCAWSERAQSGPRPCSLATHGCPGQAQASPVHAEASAERWGQRRLLPEPAPQPRGLSLLQANLTKSQNEFKIVLKELEDSLLARLSAASGNFLGDTALVENLETTKHTASEIEEKVSAHGRLRGGPPPPVTEKRSHRPMSAPGPKAGSSMPAADRGSPQAGDRPTALWRYPPARPTRAPFFFFEVQEAKITEAKINEARENYRPAAERASLLYFILNDLNKINPIYQFSLKVWLQPGSGAGGLESTEPPAVRTVGVQAADRGGKREPGHGICSRPAPRGGAPLPVPQTPTRRGNKLEPPQEAWGGLQPHEPVCTPSPGLQHGVRESHPEDRPGRGGQAASDQPDGRDHLLCLHVHGPRALRTGQTHLPGPGGLPGKSGLPSRSVVRNADSRVMAFVGVIKRCWATCLGFC